MARMILNATVGTSPQPSYGSGTEPNAALAAQAVSIAAVKTATAAAVTAEVSTTAVANAVAALVADGASPTQAHVTTLNSAWGTLLTAIGTLNTAIGAADTAAAVPSLTAATAAVSPDTVLIVNSATVLTKNKFKQIIGDLVNMVVNGSDLLT
jgi:hypothetical protein